MIHVAIISHGHEEILMSSQMGGLLRESARLKIWVKDNLPSAQLKAFCLEHAINYSDENPGLGFGHNNNILFERISQQIGFHEKDIFVVMNPDITIQPETLYNLVDKMLESRHKMATLNLFRDQAMTIPDTNIRHYPSLLSILRMPLVNSFSETYDKERIESALVDVPVEWASGAFLAFSPSHFAALGGFDPRYFMYFEDVDICYRSRKFFNQDVHYYPQLKAIHTAAHKNRNITSQHARWFFVSFFKFLIRRYFGFPRFHPNGTTAPSKS